MKKKELSSNVSKLYPFFGDIRTKSSILPFCVDLMPTNICNANCYFCSNKNRNLKETLSLEQVKKLIDKFHLMGVELSGGGDPLCHPQINEIVDYLLKKGCKIGMITNGINLDKLKRLKDFVWLRISLNPYIEDEAKVDFGLIPDTVHAGGNYIINKNTPKNYLDRLKRLKNHYPNLKYIRIVINAEEKKHTNQFEDYGNGIFFIDREYKPVENPCYMGSIKPTIAADGRFYPCCFMAMENGKYLPEDSITFEDIKNFTPYMCKYERCLLQDQNDFIKDSFKVDPDQMWFI